MSAAPRGLCHCRDLARGKRVAVSLWPAQFKGRNLVLAAAQALGACGLSPGKLEITETVVLRDTAILD